MNDYIILTDGGASLTPEICARYNIECIGMDYLLDNQPGTYKPDMAGSTDICESFYNDLRAGKPVSTTQITMFAYEEAFRPYLAAGKRVLYCCFSSGLSATWKMAQQAANTMKEEFPDGVLRLVDTLSAAAGQCVFAIQAAKNRDAGMSLEENAAWLEENALNVNHWFTVTDLDHLKRGGRVSPAVAFIGGLMNIRPMMMIKDDGSLDVYGKCRGKKGSYADLVKHLHDFKSETTSFIVMDQAGCTGDAAELIALVQAECPEAEIISVPLSPEIGAHTGPGMMSVCFVGKHRS